MQICYKRAWKARDIHSFCWWAGSDASTASQVEAPFSAWHMFVHKHSTPHRSCMRWENVHCYNCLRAFCSPGSWNIVFRPRRSSDAATADWRRRPL